MSIKEDLEALQQMVEIEERVKAAFGFQDTWEDLQLSDQTEVYWHSDGNKISFDDEPFEIFESGDTDADYDVVIFSTQGIMRAEGYCLVAVDTQTDGNKYLYVLDESKELKG